MSEEQKKLLEAQLWAIANELRGKMDADEFRDYILGFIFYKYLSEKQLLFANKLLETEDNKDYTLEKDEENIEAIKEESLEKLGYFLKPEELFSSIAKKGNADTEDESNFILEDLQAILNSIERSTMGTESEDDFNHLFEDLDLGSTKLGRSVEARNTLISKVLSHLDKIDFALEDTEADVLGDAYEYLIAQFASGAGKKAGEFYTPQQVSKVLAKIVTTDKQKIKSAYDPTCGSGSLLLRIAREAEVGEFFGQELNRTTYNLARMNMILHDVHFSKFDIKQEDTLEEPQHLDKRFEAIVANPPFSAKWKGKDNPLNETDDRFSQYGKLAPSSKADFAFIQHMIHQLAENGTAAIVLPHGALFRGAAEGTIREYIIKEQNYLDAVIGLPPNLFYGTGIPACILVFKKCRVHSDNILFIDASAEFEKSGVQNILNHDQMSNIISTYRERKVIDKYSSIVTVNDIASNGFNLNIPRYVDTFIEEEDINVEKIANRLELIDSEISKNNTTILKYCSELGVSPPNGNNSNLLRQYTKGLMQKVFTQKLRFKDACGKNFDEWNLMKLSDLCIRVTDKNKHNNQNVLTISAQKGLVNQLSYFNNSVAGKDLTGYYYLKNGNFAYNRSYSKGFPMGAIKKLNSYTDGIVSTLYICFKSKDVEHSGFLEKYFNSGYQNQWLQKIAQEGARNHGLLNMSIKDFFEMPIPLPSNVIERQKITDFFDALEKKIELLEK